MAKRKTAVNDIIYELDNDDIVISSDDEGKEPKITRSDLETSNQIPLTNNENKEDCPEIIQIDCSIDEVDQSQTEEIIENGGKTNKDDDTVDNSNSKQGDFNLDRVKSNKDVIVKTKEYNTTLYNEDIVVDSPASNVDLGVVGCENRIPLVTLRFKDNRLANTYKKTVKEFMLRLIKLHNEEKLVESDDDTDIELDIWPEDLVEDEVNFKLVEEQQNNLFLHQDEVNYTPVREPQDHLFFVDTAPCKSTHSDVPKYSQASSLISNIPEKSKSPPPMLRRGPTCFNCDGAHPLRDCPLPRNHAKIAEKRKNMGTRVGRYHVEDDQKYGHLVPGRISGQLRNALNLKRSELPLYIYRMRVLGYPPGWLEEARISHSGITLFDSTGHATLDPDEEEGEVCEPGSKDKFDIKKILDFPGFNVQASSRYVEEAHLFGLPPISEQDSKMMMLQNLAPNAMKAYKRKKLTFFPSAARSALEGQAEMDLDSGDEAPEFPLVPPLPDEEPPEIPPPPPPLPPPSPPPEPKVPMSPPDVDMVDEIDDKDDDLEVIEVMTVHEIPVPEEDLIVIDVEEDDSQCSDLCISPSLDDLEQKKMLLLDALEGNDTSEIDCSSIASEIDTKTLEENESQQDLTIANGENDKAQTEVTSSNKEENSDQGDINKKNVDENVDQLELAKCNENILVKQPDSASPNEEENVKEPESLKASEDKSLERPETESNEAGIVDQLENIKSKEESVEQANLIAEVSKTKQCEHPVSQDVKENSKPKINADVDEPDKDLTKTPDNKPGKVKDTSYGTPVMNIASPYTKLPSDNKFAKDICDIINFENLPNSTGKYKKICSLLKKVKNEVDRIQDS